MTTIAATTQAIACDSQITVNGVHVRGSSKITKIGGSLFGLAGDCEAISIFSEWVKGGRKEDAKPEIDAELTFFAIELNADGLYLWPDGLYREQVLDGHIAIGTGAQFALGALSAGADLVEAVEIACKWDVNSSEPIHVETLKANEANATKSKGSGKRSKAVRG